VTSIALIAGLGNPGPEHARDRHNAGFWFADALASAAGGTFREESRFHGEVCRINLDGNDVWLIKPGTYMNRSGQAVAALAGYYKVPREAILVVHDELDLPPGVVRLKRDGGHGGHNGLRDLIASLGGKDFMRLRIGIGHPGHRDEVTDYVLHSPSASDRTLIENALHEGLQVLPQILAGDFEKVMTQLHTE
jgi:PTH1 family peptidyl-tRNA hydrolase